MDRSSSGKNPEQDAEKARQHRSQSLVSLQRTARVRFGRRTPCGLAGRAFCASCTRLPYCPRIGTIELLSHSRWMVGKRWHCAQQARGARLVRKVKRVRQAEDRGLKFRTLQPWNFSLRSGRDREGRDLRDLEREAIHTTERLAWW